MFCELSVKSVAFGASGHIIGVYSFEKVIPMNNFGSWLRQAGTNITNGIQRFMAGRYGHDRLNMAILILGVILSVLSIFMKNALVNVILNLLSYVLLIVALVRCFSRSTYKRSNEHRKFLLLVDRIKDRNNRYFACPKCKQTVRVPRGKGKISITCPNCREKFIKKT